MKFEERNIQLKKKAEKIVNFDSQEISQISAEEIQRLFYDLQVYQIELEMQNDELEKAQMEIASSLNRYHFLYHQIPVGIVNHQGFIEDSNQYFCQMMNVRQPNLIKKHLTSLVVDKDKNQLINHFDAFFKAPDKKSINLQMQGNLNNPLHIKLMPKLDNGNDFEHQSNQVTSKLIITVTDINDIVSTNN